MSRLTLFTAPKPFVDARIAMIQTNALASWAQLEDVELLLMGEGQGLAEVAKRFGATHIPDVDQNSSGTPLISSMIDMARLRGKSKLLCIINADMIIMHDLVDVALAVSRTSKDFVLLGRRWDVTVEQPLEFSKGWEDRLRALVRDAGVLHRPTGSDFFVFPRHLYSDVPDFAVGRAGWDNWMICAARQGGIPVIDCTPSVMVVHQNHDYSHLPGGIPHYGLPESDENIRLAGGVAAVRYTLLDATHVLRQGRLVRLPISTARLMRGLERLLRRALFFLPDATVEELARPKRWSKRIRRTFEDHRFGKKRHIQ